MKQYNQGYVYLTEVKDGTVRPAIIVNTFDNHSVIIPLRAVTDNDIANGLPEGDVYVQFEGNTATGSVAQVGSIKSVPNKKIGRLLGQLYSCDEKTVVEELLTERS